MGCDGAGEAAVADVAPLVGFMLVYCLFESRCWFGGWDGPGFEGGRFRYRADGVGDDLDVEVGHCVY